jgi:hypothetical protein
MFKWRLKGVAMSDQPTDVPPGLYAIPVLTLLIWGVWHWGWHDQILAAPGNPTPPGPFLAPVMTLLLAQGLWPVLAGLGRTVAGDRQRRHPATGRFLAAGLLGLIAPIANIDGIPVMPLFLILFGGPAEMVLIALAVPFAIAFGLVSLTGAHGGWGLTLMTARLWAATYGGMILLQGFTPLVWR